MVAYKLGGSVGWVQQRSMYSSWLVWYVNECCELSTYLRPPTLLFKNKVKLSVRMKLTLTECQPFIHGYAATCHHTHSTGNICLCFLSVQMHPILEQQRVCLVVVVCRMCRLVCCFYIPYLYDGGIFVASLSVSEPIFKRIIQIPISQWLFSAWSHVCVCVLLIS